MVPIMVPKTMTSPILVINPPNPPFMFSTILVNGIPEANPTNNVPKISDKNGCNLNLVVVKTINNTPISKTINNI